MKRLCYVFSRYSRVPYDGKQNQLFKLLPLLAKYFDEIELLGLARSKGDLLGNKWKGERQVDITEVVFPGSYDVQSLVCLVSRYLLIPWPGLRMIRRWILDRDDGNSVFFFEGFPLAGLLGWPRTSPVFWGEVDSYLRRAHRLRRMGIRRGLAGFLGLVAAKRLERIGLITASATHVYSESDATFLKRVHRRDRAIGIPMACNVESLVVKVGPNAEIEKILVWADCSYPYLEASVRAAFEAIGPAAPERSVEYIFLVGNNQRLKNEISEAGWEVYSRVDDLDRLVRDMYCVLLPDLSGTGIKNRTLYALARGICVVGTRIAWEGIPMINGIHGLHLEDFHDLNSTLCELILSGKQAAIGANGRDLISHAFSPDEIGRRWALFFGYHKTVLSIRSDSKTPLPTIGTPTL